MSPHEGTNPAIALLVMYCKSIVTNYYNIKQGGHCGPDGNFHNLFVSFQEKLRLLL